jgi:hypothetical protein
MTITYRNTKGTALTYNEMDENIRDLRQDTTIDRVLENGNTTTKNITVGSLNATDITVTGQTIGFGSSITWQSGKTSNFDAIVGNGYFVDTTLGPITATLPVSPTIGQQISFVDVAGTFDTNNLTIARNGNPIQRDNSDLTVSIEGAGFTLVYYNATLGWILTNK